MVWTMAFGQCPPSGPLPTPYFENFDALATGITDSNFANCWVSTSSDLDWETESGETGSSNTGPADDVTRGGVYVYMETSDGSLGDTSMFISPELSLSNLTNPELSFYYHMYGSDMGGLEVKIWNGSTWTSELTLTGEQDTNLVDPWNLAVIDLSAYSGSIKIMFLGTRGGGYEGDMAVDEVKVDEAATCPVATALSFSNITATSMDLNWDAVASASSGYTVIYGPAGFDPATAGTSANVTTNAYTLTGLSGVTEYDAYVISDCGAANGLADTSASARARTLCGTYTAPYFRDFENDMNSEVPFCWTYYENYYGTDGQVETSGNPRGSQHLVLSSGYADEDDTLVMSTPEFTDLTAGDKQLHFFTKTSDLNDTLFVVSLPTASATGGYNYIDTIVYTVEDVYKEVFIPITTANGYNGTDTYLGLEHSLTETYEELYIDDFSYEVIPACPQPTAVDFSGITNTSVDVNFDARGGTAYEYIYGPPGFNQATITTIPSTSGNPFSVTGLAGDQTYELYLRNDCSSNGDGSSAWAGPYTFTTACDPFNLFFTNFDQDPLDEVPHCWNYYETYSSSYVEVEDYGTQFSGDQSLLIYNSYAASDDTLMAITPELGGITAGDKQLRFQAMTSDMASTIIVGTLSNSNGASAFTPIDTLVFATDDVYQEFIIELSVANGYNGTDTHVAFRHNMGSSADYLYLEDLSYELMPQCTAMLLSDIEVSNVTADSAFFNWIPGGGSKFKVEIGAAGFTPGSGSLMLSTTDTFIGVNGLSANTRYEAYFRDSCSDGSVSPYVGPLAFYTSCAVPPALSLPFTEDFEGYAGDFGRDTNLCQSNYNFSYAQPAHEGLLRFFADTGFSHSGTQAATLDDGGSANATTTNYLVFTFNLSAYASGSNEIALSFAHMQHGDENEPNDRVWVRGSQNDPWVELYNLYDNQAANGQYQVVDNLLIRAALQNAGQSLSSTTQIRFGQEDNSEATSLTGIDGRTFDDVSLTEVTCSNPSILSVNNLVDTAATFNWNALSTAQQYEVWFGPEGFYQGTLTTGGTKVMASGTTLDVDTLSPNTCYEFVVRSHCSATDSSLWSRPSAFCTPCSNFSAPYVEGFDLSTSVPDCWAEVDLSSSDIIVTSYIDHSVPVPSGPNAVEFNDAKSAYLISPSLEDLTTGQYMIEMKVAFEGFGNGYPDTLLIGTMPNQNDTGSFAPYDTIVLEATDGTFQEMRFYMDNTALIGSNNYVALTYRNSGGNWEYYMDDFSYKLIPSCPAPYALAADTVLANSAELHWTGNGSGNWQVQYGPEGFTPGNGTTTTFTNDSVNLTGINSNTYYDVYVREICGAGDTSNWSNPVTIFTPCSRADKLAGVYTIDPSTVTGGTNYSTMQEALNDLNHCGVKGHVTFNVAAGTYNGRLPLTEFEGVTVDSTITFNGGNAASVVLRDSSASDSATVYFDGADYITIKNMTIENYSSSDAWGVMLQNAANFNTIDSCIIRMPVGTTTDVIGLLTSNSMYMDGSSGDNANDLTVSNSSFIGGEIGISLAGGSSNAEHNVNISILNNSFLHQDDNAIDVDGITNLMVKDNVVDSLVNSSADAFYMIDVDDIEVSGNLIINSPDYGMYINDLNDGNTTTVRSQVVNNMVKSVSDRGIYLNDVEKVDVFHNTAFGEPGFYLNDQNDVDIRNNIFASNADYAFESSDDLAAGDVVDYNLYFTNANDLVEIGTSVYTDLAAWQAATATRNMNSVEGDPIFVSADDLHVLGPLANDAGDNSVAVAFDIDGEARPASGSAVVDMGADEFTPSLDDIAVVEILSPGATECGDSNNTVVAVIQNYGLQSQTGFTVKADLSGAVNTSLSYTYNGSLASLQYDTISLGSFNGVNGGIVDLDVYTDLTNDQDNSNDTLSMQVELKAGLAPVPTVAVDSLCGTGLYDTLYLPAGSDDRFYWLTTGNDTIGTTDSLVVGPLNAADTTFQLMAAGEVRYSLGAVDNSIGSGANYTAMTSGLDFTVTKAFTLDSVSVYPDGAGTVVVNVENASGVVVHTKTLTVPASAAGVKTAIGLGFQMAPGTYTIDANGTSTGGLYRNSSGASYPYEVPGVVSIDDANNGLSNYYYFFYDWKISENQCSLPMGSVTIYNTGASAVPSFTSTNAAPTATDLTVSFDASNSTGATTYSWNFGDGTTGAGMNTQHTYTSNGTYNVSLVVTGHCGTDSLTQTVTVQGIGLDESLLGRSLKLYPNPTKGEVNISFSTASSADVMISVSSLSGQLISSESYSNTNGQFDRSIDLSGLPKGVYLLQVQSGDDISVRRLIVD